MKKEVTMAMIIFLALIAVSLCFRQAFLTPANGSLNFLLIAALLIVGAMLLFLFGIFIKRLLADRI